MGGRRLSVLALYAGGFLGPFGGAVTSSVLPEIGADFRVSAGTAAVTLTGYLLPFAAFMLFSGTLGERWGARRTVRTAYVVYVAASALCAVSWSFPVLIGGRAVQGAANAFTTPLLLAAVAAATPRERLGRALGVFASMQAAGQTSAPLVGGLAAEASWRWAFVGAAVVAGLLAVGGLPADPPKAERPPRLRSAWRPRTLRLAAVGFVGWGCLGGMSFLVALRLGDDFGLGSGERGLVLTGFGVVGIGTARLTGWLIDRFGPRRCVLLGTTVGAVVFALVGVLPSLVAAGVLWSLAGALSQAVLVGLNALVLRDDGGNRGGSVSVLQSFRFLGGALSPMAFVPLYHLHPVTAFLTPAALVLLLPPGLLWRAAGRRGDGGPAG
ncbi:MFS transporter [Saccharothrix australiensis]|uniref:Putative MFS family arabinose efflux permease n=1 Tax=Saccharothrix australiensis TaxID=2072 RepID=A0A495W4B5_9PSEU|nr:MFS transporter [Saccharothrix australiensis]RKT55950.1 putative MFS family arabinose efflux permease [Saccharothrix australiensis]